MFFKGALLDDPDDVLDPQGPNSRSAQRMCFASVDDVTRSAQTIEAYVTKAIEVEESAPRSAPPPSRSWSSSSGSVSTGTPLAEAFEALTPGRRRAYNLHFADAKQSKTRAARVERHSPRILKGKGLRDR